MKDAIKQVYGVEVNDDELDAKDNIIGKPTFDNFKTYHNKSVTRYSPKKRVKSHGMSFMKDQSKHFESKGSHESNSYYSRLGGVKANTSHDYNIKSNLFSLFINFSKQR